MRSAAFSAISFKCILMLICFLIKNAFTLQSGKQQHYVNIYNEFSHFRLPSTPVINMQKIQHIHIGIINFLARICGIKLQCALSVKFNPPLLFFLYTLEPPLVTIKMHTLAILLSTLTLQENRPKFTTQKGTIKPNGPSYTRISGLYEKP